MISQIDPSVAWFVDRNRERKKFLNILSGKSSQRIMTIRGGPGMGKTWLTNQFRHECSCQELPYAIIDFSVRSRGYDYLEILRSIRDAMGAHNFNEFTDLVNQYFIHPNPLQNIGNTPSSSSVEIHSSLRESTIENVAGRDIIHDNHFYFSRPETPPDLLCSNLTESFKQCLKVMLTNLPAGQWIVWVFDTYEKIDSNTRDWLYESFLREIKAQTLNGLIVVISGQEVPDFPLDWRYIASQNTLEPFSLNDYREYLDKMQIELEPKRIQALHTNYSGRPLDLAMWVDAASPDDED